MALIHCPECDHEISDKATQCPYCGCPREEIEKILKKEEIHLETTIINSENPIKKHSYKKLAFIGIAVILALILIKVIVPRKPVEHKKYEKYENYAGKQYTDLPDTSDAIKLTDDCYVLEIESEGGKETYYYGDDGIIFTVVFEPFSNRDTITKEDIDNELDSLTKVYGKYDEESAIDNSDPDYSYYDDSYIMKNYMWKHVSYGSNGSGVRAYSTKEKGHYNSFGICWYAEDD